MVILIGSENKKYTFSIPVDSEYIHFKTDIHFKQQILIQFDCKYKLESCSEDLTAIRTYKDKVSYTSVIRTRGFFYDTVLHQTLTIPQSSTNTFNSNNE